MRKNTWVVIAGIVAGFNLLMVTANTAIAASDLFGSKTNDLKQTDGRERTRVAVTGNQFSFMAANACDEDTETCFTIWGSGYFNKDRDQITASGNIAKTVDGVGFATIRWLARDLISGSDKEVTFTASTYKGAVNVMISEGDRKSPARVCIDGEFIGAVGTLCTKDVKVNIK